VYIVGACTSGNT